LLSQGHYHTIEELADLTAPRRTVIDAVANYFRVCCILIQFF
jgi:hypothetical protein